MLIVNNYDIAISRGDTHTLTVTFENLSLEDNTIYAQFSVKKNPNDAEMLYYDSQEITEVDSKNQVEFKIPQILTNNPVGTYFYDIKEYYEDGDGELNVYTVMPPARFIIKEAVGDVIND